MTSANFFSQHHQINGSALADQPALLYACRIQQLQHDLSEPLTGALFDILVDIFQERLVERGAISRAIADLSDDVREHPEYEPFIQAAFDKAYAMEQDVFQQALAETRDYLGVALAETWKGLSGQFLSYDDVARVLLAVDRALSGGRYREEILESFDWREIGRVRVGL